MQGQSLFISLSVIRCRGGAGNVLPASPVTGIARFRLVMAARSANPGVPLRVSAWVWLRLRGLVNLFFIDISIIYKISYYNVIVMDGAIICTRVYTKLILLLF